jgi:hypothetical protein
MAGRAGFDRDVQQFELAQQPPHLDRLLRRKTEVAAALARGQTAVQTAHSRQQRIGDRRLLARRQPAGNPPPENPRLGCPLSSKGCSPDNWPPSLHLLVRPCWKSWLSLLPRAIAVAPAGQRNVAVCGLTVALPPRKNGNMTTKAISLDSDAYERLRCARLGPEESFSQVIKRARWDPPPSTGAVLMAALQHAPLIDDATVQRLEAAQREDAPPGDAWTE